MLALSKSDFSLKPYSIYSTSKTNIFNKKLQFSFSESLFFPSKPKLIRKSNTFYSLHKLFIITTNEEIKENIIINKEQTSFNFYYPIKPRNSIQHLIHIANKNKNKENPSEIFCTTLKDICVEICKFASLNTDIHSYKINIYDNEYHPIINDAQLTLYPPLSEIFAKVNIVNRDNENEINNIKQNLKQYNSTKVISLFNSINKPKSNNYTLLNNNKKFTSIYPKDSLTTKNIASIYSNKDFSTKSLSQKSILNSNNNEMPSKRGRFSKKWKRIKGNLKLNNKTNVSNNYSTKSFKKTKSVDQETDTNEIDYDITSFKSNPTPNFNSNNYLYNTSCCNSPIVLFSSNNNNNHDKSNLNNNNILSNNTTTYRYVPMYKKKNNNNKNKITFSQLNKLRIKNLNIHKNNFRKETFTHKYQHLLPFSPFKLKTKNLNTKITENKNLFKLLNISLNKLITNNIEQCITDGELNLFQDMPCHYILIQELSSFPLNKLRKEFLIYVFFSNFLNEKYNELNKRFCLKLKNNPRSFDFFFQDEECESFLKEMITLYDKINKERLFLLENIQSEINNNKLYISYMLFMLVIILNETNVDYVDVDTTLIIIHSMKVKVGCSLTFQDYCNINLYFKRVHNLSKYKQFFLLKEIIKELNNNEQMKECEQQIKKLFGMNEDLCDVLLKWDLITIHKANNVKVESVFKEVERIFYNILVYYNVNM